MLESLEGGGAPAVPEGPEGLLGELVDWLVGGAMLPQPALALGNALTFCGALYGRRYKTDTDLRTNTYAIGTAPTGAGKERSRSGIKKLVMAAGLQGLLGGERLVSGSGLITAVSRSPRCLFQLDEFGDFLEAATSWKASGHQTAILSDLMRLHSAASSLFCGTEYADPTAARKDIAEPCASLWATTTPSVFWEALKSRRVLDGFLNRFLVFKGQDTPAVLDDPPGPIDPPDWLVGRVVEHERDGCPLGIMGSLSGPEVASGARLVPFTEAGQAERKASAAILADCKADAVRTAGEAGNAVWARAQEHAIRCALIRAISRNPAHPAIEASDMSWGNLRAIDSGLIIESGLEKYAAENEHESQAKRILRMIEAEGADGLGKNKLTRKTQWLDQRQRNSLLTDLEEAGLVRVSEERGTGRPLIVYTASRFHASPNGHVEHDEPE